MKKTAIYVYASLVIASLAMFAFARFSSFHTITFKTDYPNLGIQLYRQTDDRSSEKIGAIQNGSKFTLENGKYYYMVTGEHIAPSAVKFEVTRSEEMAIKANFTSDYLKSLLAPEEPAIHAVISKYSPKVDVFFTINKGELFGRGEWYGTTLTNKNDDPAQPSDNYRVVLKKENGLWQLIGKPELTLSAPNYPSVPKEYLSKINQLDPSRIILPESEASYD